jgi:hypothetical protein
MNIQLYRVFFFGNIFIFLGKKKILLFLDIMVALKIVFVCPAKILKYRLILLATDFPKKRFIHFRKAIPRNENHYRYHELLFYSLSMTKFNWSGSRRYIVLDNVRIHILTFTAVGRETKFCGRQCRQWIYAIIYPGCRTRLKTFIARDDYSEITKAVTTILSTAVSPGIMFRILLFVTETKETKAVSIRDEWWWVATAKAINVRGKRLG